MANKKIPELKNERDTAEECLSEINKVLERYNCTLDVLYKNYTVMNKTLIGADVIVRVIK